MRISDWSSDVCSSDLAIMNRTNAARCPRVFERHSMWKTMAEWRQLGLVTQGAGWPADHVWATLLEPDGIGPTAYLLTGTYRVILAYNCSHRYGSSVGMLAAAVDNYYGRLSSGLTVGGGLREGCMSR